MIKTNFFVITMIFNIINSTSYLQINQTSIFKESILLLNYNNIIIIKNKLNFYILIGAQTYYINLQQIFNKKNLKLRNKLFKII